MMNPGRGRIGELSKNTDERALETQARSHDQIVRALVGDERIW